MVASYADDDEEFGHCGVGCKASESRCRFTFTSRLIVEGHSLRNTSRLKSALGSRSAANEVHFTNFDFTNAALFNSSFLAPSPYRRVPSNRQTEDSPDKTT